MIGREEQLLDILWKVMGRGPTFFIVQVDGCILGQNKE